MEQVRHARIPVYLDAVLIGKKTVPKGCKVRNVSNHGLLLQCDADGRIQTFRDGDLVDIHLLFQRPDGTKYLTITATVRHVDTNGIGVEFCQPDKELIRLIESYRIDENQSVEATISHRRKAAGPGGPATVVTHPASSTSAHLGRRKPRGDTKGLRRYFFGLLLLMVAVGIFTADYLRTFGLSSRVAVLESLVGAHDVELARFQSRFLARDAVVDIAGEYSIPVKSSGSVSTPESEVSAGAPLQHDALAISPAMETAAKAGAGEATGTPSTGQSSEEETTAAMIVEPAGLAGQVLASAYVDSQDAEKHGSWVINLLSSPNKSDADRFAGKARKLGIPVEQETIRLKGKEFFRVQLTGFLTENQAEESAGPVKKRLGLKEVWIFKP
jgi:PilZ domain/SPOR domain